MDGLHKKAEDSGGDIVYSFKGKGSTETGLISKIAELVSNLEILINKFGQTLKLSVDTAEAEGKIDQFISKYVDMWTPLGKWTRNKYWYELAPGFKPHAEGGPIPGYGGGDTVPAMLEKGEFVIRKEAVRESSQKLFEILNSRVAMPKMVIRREAGQKYGQELLTNLNSVAQTMSIGGLVRPAVPKFSTGGSVSDAIGVKMSKQLHTIKLDINNTAHTVYGDDRAVSGLVKALRREQLVTA